MDSSEIIVHRISSSDEFGSLVKKAFSYSLLSLPFTVDRMRLKNIKSRILNIYKGKIAEGVLENWAQAKGLPLDFKSGESGFWTRDLYDFSFQGIEWDLKNNFTHSAGTIPPEEYLMLPALVPNRHAEDQWEQAVNSKNKGFLFSFMSNEEFPSPTQIGLSGAQTQFIQEINQGDIDRNEKPFEESWFFEELKKRGSEPDINHRKSPTLVITGYAGKEQFQQFLDTDGIEHFNYAMFGGKWYELDNKNRLNFRRGLVRTRIQNATCPVQALPSFKTLIEASEK